jgi:hypothetical protein
MLMGWIASSVVVRQSRAEPELGSTALLLGWRGPLSVFYLGAPVAFVSAVASWLHLLNPIAEFLLMCAVPLSAIVFVVLFFRRWHEAIRKAEACAR